MWLYILKRVLQGLLTVWFIATATFFAMHNVPGDPLTNDRAMTETTRANLEAKYGLDQPITTQYLIFLRNLARGDFGISFVQENREVNDIIREHFPVSAILGVLAVVFAATGGVLFGALTALYRNRLPDYLIMFLVILGISVPSFVVAALSQLSLVSLNTLVGFTVLPVAGWGTVMHMLVPALVLGLSTMAYLTRLMRSSMLEVTSSDYVRTAKSKAFPDENFHPASAAQCHSAGCDGSGASYCCNHHRGFVVELVFAIPGLGRYFVEAVQQLDYTVIMGTTVFYGAFLVFMVILVDVVYGFIDPRVRLDS